MNIFPLSSGKRLSDNELYGAKLIAESYGYIKRGWEFCGQPLVLDRAKVALLVSEQASLLKIIREIPNTMFEGNTREFLRACSFTPEQIDLYHALALPSPKDDTACLPMRWDVLVDDTGPKLIEVNLGPLIGGYYHDPLQLYYDACYKTEAATREWSPAGQVWWRSIEKHLDLSGGGESVALVEIDRYRNNGASYCGPHLARCLGTAGGVSLTAVRSHAATLSTRSLQCGPESFDAGLIEVFEVSRLAKLSDSFSKEYVSQVSSKQRQPVMSLWSDALSRKTVLALCHEYAEKIGGEDANLIRRLIPRTTRLVKMDRRQVLDYKSQYVLKSAHGARGETIVAGRECSRSRWSEEVDARYADDVGAVIQDLVTPSGGIAQTWVGSNGSIKQQLGIPILGITVIGDEIAGTVMKMGPPESIVISGAKAGVGTIRLV